MDFSTIRCVYTILSVLIRSVLHQVETAQGILGSQKPLPETSVGLKGKKLLGGCG